MHDDRRGLTESAISIAEITGEDAVLLDQLEGQLLLAGGREAEITPAELATAVDLDRSKVLDVVRQLRRTDAVERIGMGDSEARSNYRIDPVEVRRVLEEARRVLEIVDRLDDRAPPASTVQPLVTFPEDPAFEGVSPYDFEMKWLMPSLTSAIKRTTDSITIVTPFFDETGFGTLQGVLIEALRRDVGITIITRYLTDRDSYNRYVLSGFASAIDEAEVDPSNLTLLDYTVWEGDVPAEERTQDGATPAFTLHAKLMLFDEREAYIGSANVTDYGFDRYLELGVLLSGPPVPDLADLVQFLITSDAASEVDLQA